ncbi:hypothetical protein GTA08_BOTSDO11845 [Neofusicoccum parvum]|uniref:Uncharacterized protein upf0390 n=3 Tax=Neofusicoccum TaxID=407951 RepID=R1GJN9_BOTPV|nr:uncharacterized protein upf0390 [Neofusicoccum parvum UCRNP2]GME22497.1 hypothetical protein GTA08_BOTSDO11845 [Neofusicoccum parvum]GME46668.1 hypothetical protein GTA08_BOTSDO11845 [Neofusicoccum parvum]
MAQGAIKQKAKPAGGSGAKKASQPLKPRGSRQIAPKKQKIIQQKKLLKKHSAGLTALTEKALAEKAGHLEMLRGGKKDKKDEGKKK